MAKWLVKSEPFKYSWQRFFEDKTTIWDGVRNYQARNNLKAMKKGDNVFFYHSNEGLEIVGIAVVSKTFFTDPTSNQETWVAVELQALTPLKNPVSLKQIKQYKELNNLSLLKLPRLSVSSVEEHEWQFILNLSKKN